MDIKGTILSRIGWIYVLFLLGALSILGKIIYLQIAERDKWKAKAEEMSQRTNIIPATRGNILDTYGNPIASTVPAYVLAIDPVAASRDPKIFEKELPDLAKGLSRIFGDKSSWEYEKDIREARREKKEYFRLQSSISFAQAEEVRKLPLFRNGRYKGGLILDPVNLRLKPYDLLAKRTIGYTQEGEEGKLVGLEGKFDSYLKGEDGLRYEYRLGGNNWIPASTENYVEPRDGNDIVTTLNMNYQDVAETALHELLVDMEAEHGCAVLMEVQTGDIKAMANLGIIEDGTYHEIYNYAVGEMHEPGSTFKLPSLMAALESGRIDLDDSVNTFHGEHKFHGSIVRDAHTGGFGVITVKEVFEVSSNIGMGVIAERCFSEDPMDFIERLYAMGLKGKTGIEIDGEEEPYIKTKDDPSWSSSTLPFIAHGYELMVTPLQILTFYNAVANNGKMVAPRIVKAINYHSHTTKTFGPRIIKNSICSRETIEKAKSCLEGVVENGTAKKLANDRYKIAGKTGTAVINQGGRYEDEEGNKLYRASFVGYFPADNPKYSCIVVVSKPKKKYYGADVAGQVFLTIADKVYATDISLHPELGNYTFAKAGDTPELAPGPAEPVIHILEKLGIPFSGDVSDKGYTNIDVSGGSAILQEREFTEGTVPDVTGMGLTDALPLLENKGLKVIATGYGRVLSQSISPGEKLVPGKRIELILGVS